jgi:hypothetical protein
VRSSAPLVRSNALLQGDQAQSQTAAPKTLCFLFCFAVLPQVRSNAPTCAIERSTRQQLRQFVSFSFYLFVFIFSCYFNFFLFLFTCGEVLQHPMDHVHFAMTLITMLEIVLQ